jgi:hypothetical protein
MLAFLHLHLNLNLEEWSESKQRAASTTVKRNRKDMYSAGKRTVCVRRQNSACGLSMYLETL